MCNCLDRLRRQAEQQSFNNTILPKIEETKQKLKQKILNLQIEGNHYEAEKTKKQLARLVETELSMKKMLGCERIEHDDALSPVPYVLSLPNGLSLSCSTSQKPNKKMKGEKQ